MHQDTKACGKSSFFSSSLFYFNVNFYLYCGKNLPSVWVRVRVRVGAFGHSINNNDNNNNNLLIPIY